MWSIKYIFDENKGTLEDNKGILFLDNNSNTAKFYSIGEARKYLKENDLSGTIGIRLNMEINNCND